MGSRARGLNRDLLRPGVEPASPILSGKFFTTEPPGKPRNEKTDKDLLKGSNLSITLFKSIHEMNH